MAQNIIEKIKIQCIQFIAKIKALPKNKQIAYGAIVLGILFILLAILFW